MLKIGEELQRSRGGKSPSCRRRDRAQLSFNERFLCDLAGIPDGSRQRASYRPSRVLMSAPNWSESTMLVLNLREVTKKRRNAVDHDFMLLEELVRCSC